MKQFLLRCLSTEQTKPNIELSKQILIQILRPVKILHPIWAELTEDGKRNNIYRI